MKKFKVDHMSVYPVEAQSEFYSEGFKTGQEYRGADEQPDAEEVCPYLTSEARRIWTHGYLDGLAGVIP